MARAPKSFLLNSKTPAWALDDAACPVVVFSVKKHRHIKSALLSVGETASHLNISTKTVRRLIVSGKLNTIRIGRLVRIKSEEIERFINTAAVPSDTAQKIKEEDGDE